MSISRSRTFARPASLSMAALLVGTVAAVVPATAAHAATWSVVTTPNASQYSNRFNAVDARTTSDAWAVGLSRHDTHPGTRPLAARWNGSAWSIVPTPTLEDYGTFRDVDANAANNAWAVGSQEMFVGNVFTNVALTERWNGTSWTRVANSLPAGANFSSLGGVKVLADGSTWAVGSAYHTTAPNNRTLIQQWNGTGWTVVSSPNPSTSNVLNAIDGVSANDLWAVGNAGSGSARRALVLRWNGTAWSSVTLPAPAAGLSEIEIHDVVAAAANDVWVVGRAYNGSLFRSVAYYLRWNGSSWQSGTTTAAYGFMGVTALSATQLYATGSDTITRWNGSAWVAESASVSGAIEDLSGAPGSTHIHTVGGRFDQDLFTDRTFAMRTTNG